MEAKLREIKIRKADKPHLKELSDENEKGHLLMEFGAALSKSASARFWKTAILLYPELAEGTWRVNIEESVFRQLSLSKL